MPTPPSSARHAVAVVLFGNFVVGSGVLVVPGMLDQLARDLAISVPTAGSLLGLAALAMCIGAPLGAAFTSTIDRRRLLVAALLVLALGHLLCALAPSYAVLAWVRPFSVLGAAVFTPQAAATLALMVPVEQRAQALTTAFVGWSLASVLGMPLGNLVAEGFSWRGSFALVAVLGFVAALAVWRVIPAGLKVPPLSFSSWAEAVRHRRLGLVIGATMAWCAGHFTVLGYITPALRTGLGASAATQALLMGLMGIAGLVGNIILSRQVSRIGADRGARVFLGCVLVGLVMWSVALAGLQSLPATALAILVWGLGNFAFTSAQQARLAQTAPALASASIALNSSSLYAGQAIGAVLGGGVVAAFGYDLLGPIAVALIGLAWAMSRWAESAEFPTTPLSSPTR
jgi:predicted MFS family arabinose efflux permease